MSRWYNYRAFEVARSAQIVPQGVLSIDPLTGKMKVGDNHTRWRDLPELGGGDSGAPLRARIAGWTTAFAGPVETVDLIEGENEAYVMSIPFAFAAAHQFGLHVTAPAFSAGTLHLDYAELDVVAPDGTQARGVGLDGGHELLSGDGYDVVFDNGAEFATVGTDLTISPPSDHLTTAAGGLYVFACYVVLTATGLVA
jgi:hypothetical protein